MLRRRCILHGVPRAEFQSWSGTDREALCTPMRCSDCQTHILHILASTRKRTQNFAQQAVRACACSNPGRPQGAWAPRCMLIAATPAWGCLVCVVRNRVQCYFKSGNLNLALRLLRPLSPACACSPALSVVCLLTRRSCTSLRLQLRTFLLRRPPDACTCVEGGAAGLACCVCRIAGCHAAVYACEGHDVHAAYPRAQRHTGYQMTAFKE